MSLLPKLGGFLLVPTAGAIATRVAVELVPRKTLQTTIALGAVAHAAVAYCAYRQSENRALSEGTRAFARGGMWGEIASATFIATLPFFFTDSEETPVGASPHPSSNLASLHAWLTKLQLPQA